MSSHAILAAAVAFGALCGAGSRLDGPALAQHAEVGNRDDWQRPRAVMDALQIHAGSRVADIGAGGGYFTFHLAERVGAKGRVYAVDVDPSALLAIQRRASERRLRQIVPVLATESDPGLPPASIDVALIVNTYHELRDPDGVLQALRRALRPHGLLGLIDCSAAPDEKPASYMRHHRIPPSEVMQDAADDGFRFLRSELGFVDPATPFSYWFFLVFEPATR